MNTVLLPLSTKYPETDWHAIFYRLFTYLPLLFYYCNHHAKSTLKVRMLFNMWTIQKIFLVVMKVLPDAVYKSEKID